MTSTYDDTGVTMDRYADILTRLIALTEEQFGDSVITDEDEYIGHQLRNMALLVGESNEVIQAAYDALVINNSSGAKLAGMVELIGLERLAAAYSTTTLTLTATDATTVPAGTRYGTSANVNFATDSELVFAGSGTATVAATCTVLGVYNAAASTITTIVDPVYAISAVENIAAAVPGRLIETDSQLKVRHTNAVATTGSRSTAEIYNAVAALSRVSAVSVDDNDTATTDADGVPAYNTWTIVIGGVAADIAAAIDANKTEGSPTYGSQATVVYNTTMAQAKTINWDIGSQVPVHIAITYTADSTFPDDGEAQIKAALVAHFADPAKYRLGTDVVLTTLYRPIYDIDGVTVSTLYIDISDDPTGTSDLTMDADELATLTTANVDVTLA